MNYSAPAHSNCRPHFEGICRIVIAMENAFQTNFAMFVTKLTNGSFFISLSRVDRFLLDFALQLGFNSPCLTGSLLSKTPLPLAAHHKFC